MRTTILFFFISFISCKNELSEKGYERIEEFRVKHQCYDVTKGIGTSTEKDGKSYSFIFLTVSECNNRIIDSIVNNKQIVESFAKEIVMEHQNLSQYEKIEISFKKNINDGGRHFFVYKILNDTTLEFEEENIMF